MVYFLNTNLNTKKKVYIALTKIYGLGKYQCSQICDELGISSEKRIKQLTQTELEKLTNFITQNYATGIDIKRSTLQNVQRLIKIGTYRGFRHIDNLPVRGQKTHGNSRTVRKLKIISQLNQK
jgi:small subunit ribosomal protein S13